MTKEGERLSYKTALSPQKIADIRCWHDRAYRELRERPGGEVRYLDRAFEVPRGVFPPAPMSELLGRALLKEVRHSDRVLDMGTGCGVNAILAASCASEVVGVDINAKAIASARRNATRLGVDTRTSFCQSDLFDQVDGSFDLIVFDPPFRWFAPRDMLEAAITDEEYRTLTKFVYEVPDRLTDGGRVLLFFGTSGDHAHLHRLLDRGPLRRNLIAERTLEKDNQVVHYFVLRLIAER